MRDPRTRRAESLFQRALELPPADDPAAGTIKTGPGDGKILVPESAITPVTGDTDVDFDGGLTIGNMIMPGGNVGHLVTWTHRTGQQSSDFDFDIFGQIIDANGMPVGPEIKIDATTNA